MSDEVPRSSSKKSFWLFVNLSNFKLKVLDSLWDYKLPIAKISYFARN